MLNRISDKQGRFRAPKLTAITHRDTLKTEKICISGPVKFDEKKQIDKPAGNHPYYFLERSDHVKQDIRLVGSI